MPRYRHRNEGDYFSTYTWEDSAGNTGDYGLIMSEKHFDRIWDEVTPNFRELVRKKEILPINELTKRRAYFSGDAGFYRYEGSQGTWAAGLYPYIPVAMLLADDGDGTSPTVPPIEAHIPNPTLEDVAIKVALAKGKSFTWDALTWAAELNRLIELLWTTVKRLAMQVEEMAARAIRTAKSPAQAIEDFRNLWLEWRYGWRLLIYDVQSVSEAISEAKYTHSRGWGKCPESTTFTIENVYDNSWSYRRFYTDFSVNHLTRAGSLFELSFDGFNIGGMAELTSWEKVPFSFVWDWLMDVGTAILAATPRPGCKLHSLWLGTETTVKAGGSGVSWYNKPDQSYWWTDVQAHSLAGEYLLYRRKPLPVSDNYGTTLMPEFRLNLNWKKVLDIIALLKGMKVLLYRTLSIQSFK